MIVEHELIEQIECDEQGWAMDRVIDLLHSLGKPKPGVVLGAMLRAGYITMLDADGQVLPGWRCDEVLRIGTPSPDIKIASTPAGGEWVYGR